MCRLDQGTSPIDFTNFDIIEHDLGKDAKFDLHNSNGEVFG